MTSIHSLSTDILGQIMAFAVEKAPNYGDCMCKFELVAKVWRNTVQGSSCSEVWWLIMQREYPGCSSIDRSSYVFLRQPGVQSTARVIQRAMLRWQISKGRRNFMWGAFTGTEHQIMVCHECGVRWGSIQLDACELSSCPFLKSYYSAGRFGRLEKMTSNTFFVCNPCGVRCPDKAMGIFDCAHERESFTACYKCAGECDGVCLQSFSWT